MLLFARSPLPRRWTVPEASTWIAPIACGCRASASSRRQIPRHVQEKKLADHDMVAGPAGDQADTGTIESFTANCTTPRKSASTRSIAFSSLTVSSHGWPLRSSQPGSMPAISKDASRT